MLQYIPDYGYGEPVAVALEITESRISISRSYAAFRDRVVELDVPWQSLKVTRLEREIVSQCEKVTVLVREDVLDEAKQLGFAVIERDPVSIVERIVPPVF